MSNLEKIIRYILLNYPKMDELSKPRLVKLIYLIDWKYSIDNGKQFTNINWYYNHYGPYVDDVIELMKSKPGTFKVESFPNHYFGITDKFSLRKREKIYLNRDVKDIADKFINYTYKLNWSEFINLVYSSFPIKNNAKYTELNMVDLAEKFRKERNIS